LKLSNLKLRVHISLIGINVYFENFVFPVIKKRIFQLKLIFSR
jgi:hypothetical protein